MGNGALSAGCSLCSVFVVTKGATVRGIHIQGL